jgi:hypothetical protein
LCSLVSPTRLTMKFLSNPNIDAASLRSIARHQNGGSNLIRTKREMAAPAFLARLLTEL